MSIGSVLGSFVGDVFKLISETVWCIFKLTTDLTWCILVLAAETGRTILASILAILLCIPYSAVMSIRFCFRYASDRRSDEDLDAQRANMAQAQAQTRARIESRYLRKKKLRLMGQDQVNEKFPMTPYKVAKDGRSGDSDSEPQVADDTKASPVMGFCPAVTPTVSYDTTGRTAVGEQLPVDMDNYTGAFVPSSTPPPMAELPHVATVQPVLKFNQQFPFAPSVTPKVDYPVATVAATVAAAVPHPILAAYHYTAFAPAVTPTVTYETTATPTPATSTPQSAQTFRAPLPPAKVARVAQSKGAAKVSKVTAPHITIQPQPVRPPSPPQEKSQLREMAAPMDPLERMATPPSPGTAMSFNAAPDLESQIEMVDIDSEDEFAAEEHREHMASMGVDLGNIEDDTCAVCIDGMEDTDLVRRLSCGHIFHAECIDPWLTTRRAYCPLCKHDYYIPKPEEENAEALQSAARRGRRNTAGDAPVRTVSDFIRTFFGVSGMSVAGRPEAHAEQRDLQNYYRNVPRAARPARPYGIPRR